MTYEEEDFLMLSGIQHYSYCKRQWALIHMEMAWAEDSRTVSGKLFHEKVDTKPGDRRGTVVTSRGMMVSSSELGLSGRCDVVEFTESNTGFPVEGMSGLYEVSPVEYKVGRKKVGDYDRIQLCAEAMAIEETLHLRVSTGFIFYGLERRRETVSIGDELRAETRMISEEMHNQFRSGKIPSANYSPDCKRCSLFNICMPEVGKESDVSEYIRRAEDWR